MVAISLYRGNLHRVPDVPRRWLMPTRKISLKDFKSLLHRRSKALSGLQSSNTAVATTSNPNSSNPEPVPNSDPNPNTKESEIQTSPQLKADDKDTNREEEGTSKGSEASKEEVKEIEECSVKPGADVSDSSPVDKLEVAVEKGEDEAVNEEGNLKLEKEDLPAYPNTEIFNANADVANDDKAKRKKEVEEKLLVLNEKKHSLVQVLKQILNVEEELKRRNSMQSGAVRPSVPLQVDVTNDSGSLSRHNTPRMGSEANVGGDMEGGETEDGSNPSNHSRHILQMSSPSPSSDSPLRQPPFIPLNVVLCNSLYYQCSLDDF